MKTTAKTPERNITHNKTAAKALERSQASRIVYLVKQICLFAFALSAAPLLHAEVLIYPAGQGDHILAITNRQAITINSYQAVLDDDGDYPISITVSNVSYPFNAGSDTTISPASPVTLSGPCQLVFSGTASHLFSYTSYADSSIQTLFLTGGMTNAIIVPANKSIVFPQPTPYDQSVHTFGITKGGSTFHSNGFGSRATRAAMQLTGPLTIEVGVGSEFAGMMQIVPYYITEDFAAVPPFAAVQAPTGNFSLAIEKSFNLTNWNTVFFSSDSSAEKAFYRFKISK